MKKKKKSEVLWSIDIHGEIRECSSPSSLYEIHKEGKEYKVKYYGVSEIFWSYTFEEALDYINTKLLEAEDQREQIRPKMFYTGCVGDALAGKQNK